MIVTIALVSREALNDLKMYYHRRGGRVHVRSEVRPGVLEVEVVTPEIESDEDEQEDAL